MKSFVTSLIASCVSLYLMVAFVSFDFCFIASVDAGARFAFLFFTLVFAVVGTIAIEGTNEK